MQHKHGASFVLHTFSARERKMTMRLQKKNPITLS